MAMNQKREMNALNREREREDEEEKERARRGEVVEVEERVGRVRGHLIEF